MTILTRFHSLPENFVIDIRPAKSLYHHSLIDSLQLNHQLVSLLLECHLPILYIRYLIYPGNILMIIAAIWNARMNKFSGLPIYNKD